MSDTGAGRAILIVSAIVGFLMLVGAVGVYVLWPARPATTRPSVAQEAADREASRRRVVLENRKLDDSARAFIFRGALTRAGQRCDSVEAAIMGDPGVWRVSCAPGYRYLFAFDAAGELTSATRLP